MLLLEEKKIIFELIEYLKTPLTPDEVMSLSDKLNKPPKDFIRRSEKEFKDNNIIFDINDDWKMANHISRYPKIMERPIFVNGESAIVGRPPKDILKIII